MKYNFGCIGVGQGGINIAEEFSHHFPTIAIDTAQQNLNNCNNIKEDLRIHAKINKLGGAGKDISKGEKAIIQHEEEILELLKLNNFNTLDYVFISAGLGGGTGTLGCTQVSRLLSGLGIPHGLLITLPANYEGIDENNNASIGLYAIENIRKKSNNLRSIIIVENEKLKNIIMDKNDVSFENIWRKGNKYIFDMFYNILQFTQKDSSFTVDGNDYIKVLKKRGYMIFGNCIINDIENKSKTALVKEVKKVWNNNIFINEYDFKTAKGLALIINRPKNYNKDGKAIENLFTQMNNYIGSGTFANGLYLENSKNSLEIFTVLSGIQFPKKRYIQLKEKGETKLNEYNQKEDTIELDINLEKINNYFKEEHHNEDDFEYSIFEHNDKKEKIKKLDWSGFDNDNITNN